MASETVSFLPMDYSLSEAKEGKRSVDGASVFWGRVQLACSVTSLYEPISGRLTSASLLSHPEWDPPGSSRNPASPGGSSANLERQEKKMTLRFHVQNTGFFPLWGNRRQTCSDAEVRLVWGDVMDAVMLAGKDDVAVLEEHNPAGQAEVRVWPLVNLIGEGHKDAQCKQVAVPRVDMVNLSCIEKEDGKMSVCLLLPLSGLFWGNRLDQIAPVCWH